MEMEEIKIEEIILERFRKNFGVKFDRNFLDNNISIESIADFQSEAICIKINLLLAGKQLDIIRYPKTWKDSFKERWFPKLLLNKYPVKYVEIDIKALYPELSIPKERMVLEYNRVVSD